MYPAKRKISIILPPPTTVKSEKTQTEAVNQTSQKTQTDDLDIKSFAAIGRALCEVDAEKLAVLTDHPGEKVGLSQRGTFIAARMLALFEDVVEKSAVSKLWLKGKGFSLQSPKRLVASLALVADDTLTRNLNKKSVPTPATGKNTMTRAERALSHIDGLSRDMIHAYMQRCYEEEKSVTVNSLLDYMKGNDEEFAVGRTTLYHALRAMDYKYKKKMYNPEIFLRQDLVEWRRNFLLEHERLIEKGFFMVAQDETWAHSGMTHARAWHGPAKDWDKARDPKAAPMGPKAGKGRGRRCIVSACITTEGIVEGSELAFVSGQKDPLEDCHKEMDATMFEAYLERIAPCIVKKANGRPVCLMLDNASYHTRAIEKPPTMQSRKSELEQFVKDHHLQLLATPAQKITKPVVWRTVAAHLKANGGPNAFKTFAVETICEKYGIKVLRLPPYHCIFNPIELCWSQLKHHLRSCGTTSDKVDLVQSRTLTWLRQSVKQEQCESWFAHSQKEQKSALDADFGTWRPDLNAPRFVIPLDSDSDESASEWELPADDEASAPPNADI